MSIYKIVFEYTKDDNTVVDEQHYWEAPNLLSAAKAASDYAESTEQTLKHVSYAANITRRVTKDVLERIEDE